LFTRPPSLRIAERLQAQPFAPGVLVFEAAGA
jgi:hypothetical protein